jgi:hypothetical protein
MPGTEQIATRWEDFAWGICMSSSKYHREQAKILAGLALSTPNPIAADRFNLAAMEHLERAQAVDGAVDQRPDTPEPGADTL